MADLQKMKFSLRAYFDNMAPINDEFGPFSYDLARQMLEFNPLPLTSTSVVHDNGCGNGPVSAQILRRGAETERPAIEATDLSPVMIQELKKREELQGVNATEMDSEALDFPDATFTHSFINLVLMVCTGPRRIVSEVSRTLKPGGVALATIWKSQGYAPLANSAAHAVRPDAPDYKGPSPPQCTTAEWFKGLFTDAGFAEGNVEVRQTTYRIFFKDASERARHLHCHSLLLQIASTWTDADKERLYLELQKRFDPATAATDGFESEVWHLVATK